MSEDLVEAAPAESTADESAPTAPQDAERSAWQRWRERRRNRVSRWDRPPPPKDWRYLVGTLGKILIATGLLMFGFVAYQLWGTGIETARAQNRLENAFEERFEAAIADGDATDVDDDDPDDFDVASDPGAGTDADTTDDDSDVDTDNDTNTDPANDDTGADTDTDTDSDTDAELDDPAPAAGVGGAMSDIVPGGIDVSGDAVEQDVPVVPGEAFAKLDIDKIGIEDLYVIPGVQLNDLKKGPGHYPDTPLPGQLGNASLAGHRTTYGAPFFDLDQLAPEDEIVVTMVTGDQYVYRVTGSQVVTAADSYVITTRDPNVAELTLTTCDPKYTARNRLVVHSVLVPERSSRVGVAEFYDLDELEGDGVTNAEVMADGVATDEIPGDDPTVAIPRDTAAVDDPTDVGAGAELDDGVAGGEAPDVATVDPVSPTVDEPAAPTAPRTLDPDNAELDAFSEGWFHDSAAWPQIALWAAVLVLITMLAYQLAKKTRHSSIGVLVGIAPFVVALYFFYQNVNRLLPPGL